MNLKYALFVIVVGFCSSRWGWCGIPCRIGKRIEIQGPDPTPWREIIRDILGALGGLAGGFVVTQVFRNEVSLVTVSLGALIGAGILCDIYNAAANRKISRH